MAVTEQLSTRLERARQEGFVGRATELAAVSTALDGGTETRVVFVHGPGGIGKTTLLEAMARRCERTGRRAVYLDARGVECSADAISDAIADAVGADPGRADPLRPHADRGLPPLVLIDGYELLKPLDGWFRTALLPARPAGAVTVLAGRDPPAAGWLEPGWQRLIQVFGLGALDEGDSRRLLVRLGVTEHLDRLAGLGRGYPLALAMLAEADRAGRSPNELADAPDAVRRLCALILDDVPDEAHRMGLATCAHATRTTEDLLTHTVGSRSAEVWNWLESRPYVRRDGLGLYLHDIVRELFEAEFASRSPTEFLRLHRGVRSFFLPRVSDPWEPHPERAAAEVLLLHRRTPLADDTSVLRDRGRLDVTRATPAEREDIVRLIATFEGPASADLARRWMLDQPRSAYHARSEGGTAACAIQLYLPGPHDLMRDDPIAAAIWRLVQERGGLRPGERVNVNRFGAATSAYQGDPLQLLVNGVSCILEWSTTPAAWTFIVAITDTYYGPYFDYLGLSRMLELELGGHRLVGYGWDRRRFPTSAFFQMMEARELTGETGPPPTRLLGPAPLSRADFDAAVRAALRRLDRKAGLAGSELLDTALVAPDAADPPAAMAALLRRTIADLGAERSGAEHRRVLERTYLSGAPSQEAAADVLGLPFSTYRRHLARATDRLSEILWAMELAGTR